jgi:hypothetical protein
VFKLYNLQVSSIRPSPSRRLSATWGEFHVVILKLVERMAKEDVKEGVEGVGGHDWQRNDMIWYVPCQNSRSGYLYYIKHWFPHFHSRRVSPFLFQFYKKNKVRLCTSGGWGRFRTLVSYWLHIYIHPINKRNIFLCFIKNRSLYM